MSWNDPTNSLGCPNGGGELATYGDAACESQPTPAARSSWGRVKAAYR